MSSSCRLALLLALAVAAAAATAQSSSSSANPATPASDLDQYPAPSHHGLKRFEPHIGLHRASRPAVAPAPAPAGSTAVPPQGSSVQARIRARREQRRAAAIHDAYANKYEAYFGSGYQHFLPGPGLEFVNEIAWNAGVIRYFSDRLGLTVDTRRYSGTAFVGINQYNLTNPAISQYAALAGPTYRFYVQPRFSVSGRVLGGVSFGNFSGDLGSYSTSDFGLLPSGYTFAASIGVPFEYNLTPHIGIRLTPEYYFTGFGSTIQHNPAATIGVVYRFGKQ
jgi:hypothetical protein